MCGIAGFIPKGFNGLTQQHLLAMGDSIAHRGPDAHGEYMTDDVGLCHRRLSILDLSEAGNQPMFSPDKSIAIVFNGEIYNYPELKKELDAQGISFSSSTDTEVIIYLYQKYGEACLAKLNGMFAFAIWDDNNKKLFIARDRLGKKPLYYLSHNNRFAFASEIKGILTLPDIPKDIRHDAVFDFFAYQHIPDPKSIFKYIHKLPAAHYMTIQNDVIQIQQYWDLSFANTRTENPDTYADQVLSLAQTCTNRRMLSDVPLGAFLSGGVDSSGVVALMAKQSETPVKTCTIAFDDKKFNEAEFAREIAELYKTEHHEFLVNQNVKDSLEHIVSFFDEPFADPSLVPTFFVSELARQAVTVAIAGDGGDEVFAGYEKYNTDNTENLIRQRVPRWLRHNVCPKIAKFTQNSGNSFVRKINSLMNTLSVSPQMGFYITNSHIKDYEWQQLITPEFERLLDNYHPSKITTDVYEQADGPDHLAKILFTDIKTYLCSGILVKVDRMSMANSLEVRAPLLDKEMLEFAATLPSHVKYHDGEKKFVLREAFAKLLPKDILNRKKMGFSVPLASWFRGEIKDLAEYYIIEHSKGLPQFFNMQIVKNFWQQHQQHKHDHSTILWSMLMFEMWWQKYMDESKNP